MGQLSHDRYEELERAIADGSRISLYRRGTEYIIVPTALRTAEGREAIDATHPATGERMTFFVDEVQEFQVIR